MSTRSTQIALASVIVLLIAGTATTAQAVNPNKTGKSPAVCSGSDIPEPGIQGDVPGGPGTANYNCGLAPVGQLPRTGFVQGAGQCAYIRSGANIFVVDVSNPASPVEVGSVPTIGGSESMRAVVTAERAVLVSGRAVYDISDCLHPVLKGQIVWPTLSLPGIPIGLLPHDIRVNHAGTKVYGTFGLWEADITDLNNPANWTVKDHTCEAYEQLFEDHMRVADVGLDLCTNLAAPVGPPLLGANYLLGGSALQSALLWPPLGHGPDTNGDDTRLYEAHVGGGYTELFEQPHLRIYDLTQDPVQVLAEIPGAGFSTDWFRTANGREFVLHNAEGGTGFQNPVPGLPPSPGSDTCVDESQRPNGLGWSFQAFITQVNGDNVADVSSIELAINKPEFCQQRAASGHNPFIGYHSVDNPFNATFAMVSHGTAGLRIFDIRIPDQPVEVAYFNRGSRNGASYYDAARGLIYSIGSDGFRVLQIEPQVRAKLGL